MEERETIRLSDSEWRVMEELWTAPSTLMELVRTLGNKAGWAKSTVATVLRRMEAKGLVTYEEGGKARVYHPVLRREDAALAETRSLLHRAYHGSVGLVMSALVNGGSLKPEGLEELQDILRAAERGREPGTKFWSPRRR